MGSSSTIAATHLAESLFFSGVPDDILINILFRLDEDPRDLARLVCVSTRFCKLIKTVCWKSRCERTLPLLVAELLQSPSPALQPCPEPPGGWASLQKLLVCCPGLWHAGVLLENWDFGLDREIGWFDDFLGASHSDGLIHPESIIPELGYAHSCESVGNKSCDRTPNVVEFTSTPFATEYHPTGAAACMVFPDVNDVKANVSCDVCGLNFVNSCAHYSEAGMNCDENAGGMDCENEADVSSRGKEMGTYTSKCDKKQVLTHMVAKECLVRDHEFQESAEEKDDALVKEETPQIYKSTSMQSWPTLLNNDPSSLMTLEAGCRHQSKDNSDLVETTHVSRVHIARSCVTSRKTWMHKHRLKSCKRQRKCQNVHCHVATRPWNLSREQGNKLLANRFRADSLYICDWPGCSHPGDKRMYKLFRGVFKNFKHSHVWRNLKDMQAKATNVGCAFCVCNSTWDMVTTFCLKRSIEYHDDGEPVVRAYVCENGHVAGAWTDRPMYTI